MKTACGPLFRQSLIAAVLIILGASCVSQSHESEATRREPNLRPAASRMPASSSNLIAVKHLGRWEVATAESRTSNDVTFYLGLPRTFTWMIAQTETRRLTDVKLPVSALKVGSEIISVGRKGFYLSAEANGLSRSIDAVLVAMFDVGVLVAQTPSGHLEVLNASEFYFNDACENGVLVCSAVACSKKDSRICGGLDVTLADTGHLQQVHINQVSRSILGNEAYEFGVGNEILSSIYHMNDVHFLRLMKIADCLRTGQSRLFCESRP